MSRLARLDRLLELAWETGREPLRVDLAAGDRQALALSGTHYRGVALATGDRSAVILPRGAAALSLRF